MKRFITWLTRPKITVFLKSGNVVHVRYAPIPVSTKDDEAKKVVKNQNDIFDIIDDDSAEMISQRKWYQPWA